VTPRRVLIVGAGLAGSRCAEVLRAEGFAGEVVLVATRRTRHTATALQESRRRRRRRPAPDGFWAEREIDLRSAPASEDRRAGAWPEPTPGRSVGRASRDRRARLPALAGPGAPLARDARRPATRSLLVGRRRRPGSSEPRSPDGRRWAEVPTGGRRAAVRASSGRGGPALAERYQPPASPSTEARWRPEQPGWLPAGAPAAAAPGGVCDAVARSAPGGHRAAAEGRDGRLRPGGLAGIYACGDAATVGGPAPGTHRRALTSAAAGDPVAQATSAGALPPTTSRTCRPVRPPPAASATAPLGPGRPRRESRLVLCPLPRP
jgi:hypothetical protein